MGDTDDHDYFRMTMKKGVRTGLQNRMATINHRDAKRVIYWLVLYFYAICIL